MGTGRHRCFTQIKICSKTVRILLMENSKTLVSQGITSYKDVLITLMWKWSKHTKVETKIFFLLPINSFFVSPICWYRKGESAIDDKLFRDWNNQTTICCKDTFALSRQLKRPIFHTPIHIHIWNNLIEVIGISIKLANVKYDFQACKLYQN